MLKGAGIHQNFGWKPAGKIIRGTPATSHDVPMPVDFSRPVKIICRWTFGSLFMRVNNDAAIFYVYAAHYFGEQAGGAINTVVNTSATDLLLLSWLPNSEDILTEMTLQLFNDKLNVMGRSWAYTDSANNALTIFGGTYTNAPPFTSLTFINGSTLGMTGEIEIFESVYGF